MKLLFANHFKKQLKKLKKKYPSVKEDLLKSLNNLDLKKETKIRSNCYKIRIASTDQKKGKSGGFRSYIYLYVSKGILAPVCIYSKSEKESLSSNELQMHIDRTTLEIFST